MPRLLIAIMKRALLLTAAVILLQHAYGSIKYYAKSELSTHADQETTPTSPLHDVTYHDPQAQKVLPLSLSDSESEKDPRPQRDHIHPHDLPLASPPTSSSATNSQSSTEDTKPWRLGKPPGASQWAVVYYPYNADSTCKNLLTVRSDIAGIARHGFTTVRLHASDCGALYKVGSAARLHNLKLIVGVHISETGLAAGSTGLEEAEAQIQDIISWASFSTISTYSPSSPSSPSSLGVRSENSRSPDHRDSAFQENPLPSGFDLIELIVVGEETLFNAFATPPELADFLNSSRQALRSAGYTGPVTTTEPIPTLYTHAATLCPAIDLPAANVQPYFRSSVSSALAADYVSAAMKALEGICPGKAQAVNLETGWPSRGSTNGKAHPGREEQREAVTSILQREGHRTVLLGWGDDGWKEPGELGVESSWGCEWLFEPGGGFVRSKANDEKVVR